MEVEVTFSSLSLFPYLSLLPTLEALGERIGGCTFVTLIPPRREGSDQNRTQACGKSEIRLREVHEFWVKFPLQREISNVIPFHERMRGMS